MNILEEADKLTSVDRKQEHGDWKTTSRTVSELSIMLMECSNARALNPEQQRAFETTIMMMLLKLTRLVNNPHNRDNYVDLVGYTKLLHSITTGKEKEVY